MGMPHAQEAPDVLAGMKAETGSPFTPIRRRSSKHSNMTGMMLTYPGSGTD